MQSYTEIPSSTILTASRPLLLNNDKSIMSCFSGTAYPTTNLQVWMLCFRTDSGKLFQLTDATNKTWVEIADTKQNITVAGITRYTANIESTSKTVGSVVITDGLGGFTCGSG